MDSTLDQLQRATLCLSQEGSIKDRLAEAYASHLASLDADDLPEHLRADFEMLCSAMRRERALPRESVVRASVRKMSSQEARSLAALVVRMFAAVARSEGFAARRNARSMAAAPIMNLFAAAAEG